MRPVAAIITPFSPSRRRQAFTLIELLVVLAIIGLLMAVGIPALKGFGKSNAVAAADRQLLDDLAYARQRAITDHTTVYMVFMPPANATLLNYFTGTRSWMQEQVTNLLQQQYASYALYVERSAGDQPGQAAVRYLTSWRSLAQPMFISPRKYSQTYDGIPPFRTDKLFQFPTVATNSPSLNLPYLEFNYLGQLQTTNNSGSEVIPLVRGSVFYDANLNPDFLENPPGNSATNTTMWHHIRIDAITGRARIEQQEVQ